MDGSWPGDRAVTPVVANILIAAVVVVLAITVTVLGFTLLEGFGTPTADASFDFERTPSGLRIIPTVLGTEVDVRLNGDTIATIEEGSAGSGVLLPTAPGDRITVVSTDGEKSLLLDRTVDDRDEVGDFVTYYNFEDGSGSTLTDQSGNGNTGSFSGTPTWQDRSLRFDGDDDHVVVNSLSSPQPVSEFTVAVAYKQDGLNDANEDVSQLVEHTSGSNEWFLETSYDSSRNKHRIDFAVEYPGEVISSGTNYEFGEKHVAVGTYDGDSYRLYVDGNREASAAHDRSVDMGDLKIARDNERNIQHLDGEIYEVRLYYTAFDADEVAVITEAMS